MDLALCVLRVIVGLLFVGHGAQKLFGAFGGHGVDGTAAFFEQLGLHPPRLHATAAGASELGGGALLALGLLTPLAAAMLIAVMTVAVVTVHARNGIWSSDNGVELPLVMAAVAFGLAGAGAGAWSLDSAFGFNLDGAGWAIGALAAGLLGGIATILVGRLPHHGDEEAEPHGSAA